MLFSIFKCLLRCFSTVSGNDGWFASLGPNQFHVISNNASSIVSSVAMGMKET